VHATNPGRLHAARRQEAGAPTRQLRGGRDRDLPVQHPNSPWSTQKDTSSTARTSPYDLTRPSTRMAAGGSVLIGVLPPWELAAGVVAPCGQGCRETGDHDDGHDEVQNDQRDAAGAVGEVRGSDHRHRQCGRSGEGRPMTLGRRVMVEKANHQPASQRGNRCRDGDVDRSDDSLADGNDQIDVPAGELPPRPLARRRARARRCPVDVGCEISCRSGS
jgi:hypothetical protein